MSRPQPPRVPSGTLRLPSPLLAEMSAQVSETAGRAVAAVVAEVPEYATALHSEYRATLEEAVAVALAGFIGLLAGDDADGAALDQAVRGAYALGRGEAQAHRSIDALLAAYRVGTRVHWRDLSGLAVRAGLPAADLADLALHLFSYTDRLSAASVAGHADESVSRARARERAREQLARALVEGDPVEALLVRAERADWAPPETLTAVLLPAADAHATPLGPGTLSLAPDSTAPQHHDETVLLVPNAHDRAALLRSLAGRNAVVGPPRPWVEVATSYRRAVRALRLPRPAAGAALDTDDHLVDLVVTADREALTDLQQRVLAPLADLPPDTAARLERTLLLWLLLQGRREQVAAAMWVHPQTVRYRMGQLRERYGNALTDPEQVRAIVVALIGRAAGS